MPKLIWEKKLQEAVKHKLLSVWYVRDELCKVLMKRYYSDTNKKIAALLPISWELNQDLQILNLVLKIKFLNLEILSILE